MATIYFVVAIIIFYIKFWNNKKNLYIYIKLNI